MARRRVDIRTILADPELRRKLMVSTIQATQAREGIETTPEQAERAYYVVTEGEKAAFFDLARFRGGNKAPERRHETFVQALRSEVVDVRFDVARRDFAAIEGAPLAYRRVHIVAPIFREAPAIEPAWGIVRQGKATGDDLRWVRRAWEVSPDSGWVPFAKGGEFCRFYADVDLVIDWNPKHMEDLRASGNGLPSLEHYFKPGLTWPLAASVFNVRVLPPGCVFGHKGPCWFPRDAESTWLILGVLNSDMALALGRTLTSRETMGGRWEVGVVRRFPIPKGTVRITECIGDVAKAIHAAKARWDEGNEISTHFGHPWLLDERIAGGDSATVNTRLDAVLAYEAAEDARIQLLYAELNDDVFLLYGIPDSTRREIEGTLGERPPELIWPQMEGKDSDQKRMEHVWRLLAYVVKRVVAADADGIVPFIPVAGEASLVDRVYGELEALFPTQSITQVEIELANELKRVVKGYRRVSNIKEWLDVAFFEFHCSLYKSRPAVWHIASSQGRQPAAFSALVDYHKFHRDRMAKLRADYLRDAADTFRREAALAAKEGRTDEALDWATKAEEAAALDARLQLVQEGHHEGPEDGERDYRILTPWRQPDERPRGWDPDLDDGVIVNIAPLLKAGVLRSNRGL